MYKPSGCFYDYVSASHVISVNRVPSVTWFTYRLRLVQVMHQLLILYETCTNSLVVQCIILLVICELRINFLEYCKSYFRFILVVDDSCKNFLVFMSYVLTSELTVNRKPVPVFWVIDDSLKDSLFPVSSVSASDRLSYVKFTVIACEMKFMRRLAVYTNGITKEIRTS
jgi:hypothetical protein